MPVSIAASMLPGDAEMGKKRSVPTPEMREMLSLMRDITARLDVIDERLSQLDDAAVKRGHAAGSLSGAVTSLAVAVGLNLLRARTGV